MSLKIKYFLKACPVVIIFLLAACQPKTEHPITADLSQKKLTADEKAKLESLRESPHFQPQPDGQEKGFFERMKEYFS